MPTPSPERREGAERRALGAEGAFFKMMDTRLADLAQKIERAEKAVSGAKRRSLLAILGAVVALALGVGVVRVIVQQNADRHDSRLAVCANDNRKTEQIRLNTQALIDAANVGRRPGTPEQEAARLSALRVYIEHQGYRLGTDGHVVAPLLDCEVFARDPSKAKPQFPQEARRA